MEAYNSAYKPFLRLQCVQLLSIVKYKAVTYSSSGYVSEYPTPAPTSAYLAPPPSSYSSYSKLLCFVIPPRE